MSLKPTDFARARTSFSRVSISAMVAASRVFKVKMMRPFSSKKSLRRVMWEKALSGEPLRSERIAP